MSQNNETVTLSAETFENYVRKSAQLDAILMYVDTCTYGVDKDILRAIAGIPCKEGED